MAADVISGACKEEAQLRWRCSYYITELRVFEYDGYLILACCSCCVHDVMGLLDSACVKLVKAVRLASCSSM